MKKLIAFVAVLGFVASIAAPLTQDSAVETYPRPLVAEVEEV
ncbi:hypothetical protein [Halobacillus halophilus]|nr:hypothetical protein [Halobacillus halophilus]